MRRGVVIYNGFDTEKLKYSLATREKSRKRLGLNSNQIVIGHVARFHSMKDHQLFLSSAREIIKKKPGTVFVAAGRNVVPENPAFPAWIRSTGLQSNFLLLGESDSVYDLYQAMDFLTVSSAWGEGFPNVLGEAMSFSVPCITTDVGESAAVVAETGRVIQPRDKASMIDAMMSCVNMSTEERLQLGEQARDRIVSKFSVELMTQGYDDLYHSLIA